MKIIIIALCFVAAVSCDRCVSSLKVYYFILLRLLLKRFRNLLELHQNRRRLVKVVTVVKDQHHHQVLVNQNAHQVVATHQRMLKCQIAAPTSPSSSRRKSWLRTARNLVRQKKRDKKCVAQLIALWTLSVCCLTESSMPPRQRLRSQRWMLTTKHGQVR